MLFLLSLLLLGFASSALANFWVFQDVWEIDDEETYRFFNKSNPNCDEMNMAPQFDTLSDVSGHIGVRVKGNDHLNPDELEVHAYQVHFTIYKNRNYHVVDTKGTDHGPCQHVEGIQWKCPGKGSDFRDTAVFHCNTLDYDAQAINFQG
ncbi:hypothetical protein PG990_001744 [Apiospora arundinis]